MGCLSRMQGNLHVRFLGEGVAVRPPPYPPDAEGSIPFARSTKYPPIPVLTVPDRHPWRCGLAVVRVPRRAHFNGMIQADFCLGWHYLPKSKLPVLICSNIDQKNKSGSQSCFLARH